ncbi:MAG: CoA transferase, partial [Rhodospirillales bacterium]|nr:CoA transferase [Rhodospirillales bacterium]
MSDYQGPLSRFTVIDLTRVRSGPTAVRHLADWGANVIKVEAPAAVDKSKGMGGARNGPDYQNIHRNKRSLTLNLKENAGRDVLMKLVTKADVVVENYRPDVKHRLGVDYDALRAA